MASYAQTLARIQRWWEQQDRREHEKRVYQACREELKRLRREYPMPGPIYLCWSGPKYMSWAGLAETDKHRLNLNRNESMSYSVEGWVFVVQHEYAHFLAGEAPTPHGREWQKAARRVGLPEDHIQLEARKDEAAFAAPLDYSEGLPHTSSYNACGR